MFLQHEFNHLRVQGSSKLLHFPNKNVKMAKTKADGLKKYQQGYFQYFKAIAIEYICYISIHGMNRIFKRNLNKFKRATWIVGFFVCLWVFIYVSFQVAYIFHTKPLVTVISFIRFPVFRIPFPEVTICNMNRCNWQRYDLAKKVFLKPEHQIDPMYENIFMEIVNTFDTLSFAEFHKFEHLTKLAPTVLHELNYVNFYHVSEFMAWKCNEIFSMCEWLDEKYDCCEIFFLRNSPLGSCLAFNTIESQQGLDKQQLDPFWPWRTKDRGIYNGLGVRVHLNENYHSPKRNNKKGILVMLNEPTVWYNEPIQIETHTQTSISIKATLHTFSNYTRILSSKVRKCLFEDELQNEHYKSLPNRAYMVENCRSQCHQEYLIKLCNCSFSLFYPTGTYRSCKLIDFPCLYYHNEKFQNLKQRRTSIEISKNIDDVPECTCFLNCNSLNYAPTVTRSFMSNMKVDFNNSYIDLDVFFQKEFLMVFLTTVFYNLTDLMASFGGLAGLCIGCSLLSLVEIAYFFTIDLVSKTWLYYRMQKRLRRHKKVHQIKVDLMENILRN